MSLHKSVEEVTVQDLEWCNLSQISHAPVYGDMVIRDYATPLANEYCRIDGELLPYLFRLTGDASCCGLGHVHDVTSNVKEWENIAKFLLEGQISWLYGISYEATHKRLADWRSFKTDVSIIQARTVVHGNHTHKFMEWMQEHYPERVEMTGTFENCNGGNTIFCWNIITNNNPNAGN